MTPLRIIANGGTFTMGDELVSNNALFDPARGWDFGEDNRPIAGEYIATHVDLQGVSIAQLQSLKDRLTATQAKLISAQYNGITKEDLSGDILYSAALSYFAANQAASQIAQRAAGIVEYRRPSFGNFIASSKTSYWFGIPKNVSFPGLMMDISRYVTMNVAKDNNPDTVIAYNKQSGMQLSAYEHLIPEKLFTDPTDTNHPQAVSAVKALTLAASQGQKIYTLNKDNQTQHQTLLTQINIDSQAMADIQNGLAAGKEVTVHQAPITQSAWTGSGYVITDPATGAGAYKISGGANGGFLDYLSTNSTAFGFVLFITGLLAAIPGVAAFLVLLVTIISIVVGMLIILAALNEMLDHVNSPKSLACIQNIGALYATIAVVALIIGVFVAGPAALAIGLLGFGALSDDFFKAVAPVCSKI